ncbi:MAG: tRNA uridine-5-carboxymethylaminomethyl(34) synthesis GTPase MnmE, partial [Clostridiales bacterium]|nr:tRNA uridine-5-carboxymethylaminomethyl(34) synthesis GTPase MnmE [Clostridiales bacterium]
GKGNIIDEVLLAYMQGPRSYTAEDVVEIHCHGGIIPITNILKEVIKKGARLAEPGEFTKRAFLNGRIDLVQAEAVMDLICAKTEKLANASINQMEGSLSGHIKRMRARLIDIMAHIEVTIDYPEEDIDEVASQSIKENITDIVKDIEYLLSTAEHGRLIRQGIKAVIIGKTNVGKSSLLNALVKEDRAIVTDIPGTTRDVIEEFINIKGVAVRIIDTAGIRETLDQVEQIGIQRSKQNIESADLIITVLDASSPLEDQDREILKYLKDRKSLIILNKIDKPVVLDRNEIEELIGKERPIVETSLTLGKGIDKVEDIIYKMFFRGELEMSNDLMITNIRHQETLNKAHKHLLDALEGIDNLLPMDIVSIDLRSAVDSLGSITGETITDDLIDKIFSEFCLGK